jgi:Kef-type K+ transport system membrane component KefB
MITKLVGVFPLARMHHMGKREASYTTLLMATGLTFGTISALFGLQNKIIDQRQYTILVSVVILSAFIPTLIAQKFFQPSVEAMHAWGRLFILRTDANNDGTGRHPRTVVEIASDVKLRDDYKLADGDEISIEVEG